MQELRTPENVELTVKKIKVELAARGWLETAENPCHFEVEAMPHLPNGWVWLYDDVMSYYGDSGEILKSLLSRRTFDSDEYGCKFSDLATKMPTSSRDWPEDLIEFEQLEDGTANDNPITLVTVGTNAGLRYAVGPHGVSECALGNWMDSGEELAETRETALTSV